MHHRGPIAGLATHGHYVASAGYDNQVILWRDRSAIARGMHDHLVNNCSFSADGRFLVSASSDYSARIWSVPEMRLEAVLVGHADDVDMAVFSPDDTLIATCALDRMVRIFNRRGVLLHAMAGHSGNVLSLVWRDARHVVSSSVDGTIRTWDAATGDQVGLSSLGVRTDTAEVGPEGLIFAGDDLGRIATIRGTAVTLVAAHAAGVKKIALNASKTKLVSLSYDRSIALWHVAADGTIAEAARSWLPEAIWARGATILHDGRVATGTFGASYALFDPQNGTWDLEGVAAGPAINAVLHRDGKTYTVGDAGEVKRDGEVVATMGSLCNFLVACGMDMFTGGQMGSLFDARTGALLYQHRSPLNCGVSFVRGGAPHLAIGTYTGEILIFALDATRPRLVAQIDAYMNAVKGLSFADGALFAVCASCDVTWFDAETLSVRRTVPKAHERIANACCALDGGRFASVGRDRTLRIWTQDAVEVHDTPHCNSVKCIAVDADRTALLTGSYGGTVARFDLATGAWGPVERPTASGVSSISWDSDAHCFLAASYDGEVYRIAA